MRFAMPVLVLVLAACSSTSGASAPDASPPVDDGGIDATAATACENFSRATFAVDGAGPDSQIHAIGAAGGDRVFVAYNRPKTGGKTFDVYLAAFGCDGKPVFDPVRVSDDSDNDVDPSIAVQGSEILVAWAGDAAGKEPNLHVRVRRFDRQGQARGAATAFTGPRKGIANLTNNIWQASIAPLGGGFAITGAWGVDEAPAFQTFGSRLDVTGAPVGDAFDLGFDAGTTQTSVDVASNGVAAWAAWLVEPNTADGQSVATATFGATGALTRGPTLANANSPSVAMNGTTSWVAAQRGAKDVVLQRLDAAGDAVVLAGKGMLPALALSGEGGAFAAYRDVAGGRTIVITRIDAAGSPLGETDLALTDAAPYPLRLVRVAADAYFLAFQSGKSPALRAQGRFVDLRTK